MIESDVGSCFWCVDPKNAWCISQHWGRFGEVEVKIRSNLRGAVDIKVCKGCKVWMDVSFSEGFCEGGDYVFMQLAGQNGQSKLISTRYVMLGRSASIPTCF
ncbi:unnamed protein product [Ectocarpus sp. 8 AP-2014]